MPYEIPSSIEVDGMDRVYLAGGKLDRDVAVKVLQITNGPGLVQQPYRLQTQQIENLGSNSLRLWSGGEQRNVQRAGPDQEHLSTRSTSSAA